MVTRLPDMYLWARYVRLPSPGACGGEPPRRRPGGYLAPGESAGKGVRAILRGLGRALVMSAATAAVVGLAAAPAFAATTYTVHPGGKITGKAGKTVVTDATIKESVTCTGSTAKGSLKSGSGLAGAGLGTITSISFKGCTLDGASVSATISGKMPLNATAYNKSKKTVSMTITKIHGTVSVKSFDCGATVDGTSATAHDGMVTATFSNKKDTLSVLSTGSNLHFYNDTCPVISNGDAVNFTAGYKLTPTQTITGS
jgi:hypothetical protein